MTNDKKTSGAREFWIREWTDSQPDGFLSGNIECTLEFDVSLNPAPESIHVIEYAAYEKLQKDKESNDSDYFVKAQALEAAQKRCEMLERELIQAEANLSYCIQCARGENPPFCKNECMTKQSLKLALSQEPGERG